MKTLEYNMKWTAALMITLVSAPLFAQTSAKEGLEHLKTNFDNSQANLDDYKKNLKIVDANLIEVAKARSQADAQDKEVAKSFEENQKSLKAVEARETEINQAIADEQKLIQTEEQKIAELEKVAIQMRENQKKRQGNISAYQEQLKTVANEKKDWKARTDQVAKTQAQVKGKVTALATQENDWKNKKRGYQGEVSRWQKEVDREKKLVDTYSSLADVKD